MIRFFRPFDPHKIRLLVFDLDGTLIDSRLDLIHSVNATLHYLGRPALDGDVIASYVGDGAQPSFAAPSATPATTTKRYYRVRSNIPRLLPRAQA